MSRDARAERLLAFDFGLRQIGVAVGNALLRTTQPLAILRARDGQPDWHEVGRLLGEWSPDQVLVGDPINMDGSVSDLARRARRFGARLHGRFGVRVAMVDERLSSYAVKAERREQGGSSDYRRNPVDSLAAELILRDYLNSTPGREKP